MTRRLLNYEKENFEELKICYKHELYYEGSDCKKCTYLKWIQVIEKEKALEKKNYEKVNRKYSLRP